MTALYSDFLLKAPVGPQGSVSDGTTATARLGRLNDLIISNLQPRYYEATKRGGGFALMLVSTSSTIAAGNITGAVAAASTQFALVNPPGSNVDLVLTHVICSIISGTLPAAPMTHDLFNANGVTLAKSGKIQSGYGNAGAGSKAWDYVSAAGAALTGAGAHTAHQIMALDFTAASFADAGSTMALENVEGKIVIPPGVGWAPCFSAAGTTLLNAWGVNWIENPI